MQMMKNAMMNRVEVVGITILHIFIKIFLFDCSSFVEFRAEEFAFVVLSVV